MLLPTTLTEADIEQRKQVLDSRVISKLKLTGFVARWITGVRVALKQLTKAIIEDSAVFLTLFLLFTGLFVGSEHVKLENFNLVEEMEGGISVYKD